MSNDALESYDDDEIGQESANKVADKLRESPKTAGPNAAASGPGKTDGNALDGTQFPRASVDPKGIQLAQAEGPAKVQKGKTPGKDEPASKDSSAGKAQNKADQNLSPETKKAIELAEARLKEANRFVEGKSLDVAQQLQKSILTGSLDQVQQLMKNTSGDIFAHASAMVKSNLVGNGLESAVSLRYREESRRADNNEKVPAELTLEYKTPFYSGTRGDYDTAGLRISNQGIKTYRSASFIDEESKEDPKVIMSRIGRHAVNDANKKPFTELAEDKVEREKHTVGMPALSDREVEQKARLERLDKLMRDMGIGDEQAKPADRTRSSDKPLLSEAERSSLSSEFPGMPIVAAAFSSAGLDKIQWNPANKEQEYLIKHLPTAVAELPKLPKGVVDGKAAVGSVQPVNDFLRNKGLSIQLNPIGEKDIAFAGTLDLSGSWSGERTDMIIDGTKYPAALVHNTSSYRVGSRTVIEAYQEKGLHVYLTPYDGQLKSFEALELARQATPGESARQARYDALKMPMIDMDQSSELRGLLGLTSADQQKKISQALMQTILKADENGFSVKQGVAFGVTRGGPEAYDVDRPFVIWAVQDGCKEPLFAIPVEKKYWRDPNRK